MENKDLKLSEPCSLCKKDIFIGDFVNWEKKAYHIECLLQKERENTKKINLVDYMIVDPANVCGIVPLIKRNYEEVKEIDCSIGFFKLHECPKMVLEFNGFKQKSDCLIIEGTKYNLDYINETRKMAKVWFDDTPQIFLMWDKEKKEFMKDMPVMLVYDNKICFVLAPRVESD